MSEALQDDIDKILASLSSDIDDEPNVEEKEDTIDVNKSEFEKLQQQFKSLQGQFRPMKEKEEKLNSQLKQLAPLMDILNQGGPSSHQASDPIAEFDIKDDSTYRAVSGVSQTVAEQGDAIRNQQELVWDQLISNEIPEWRVKTRSEPYQKVFASVAHDITGETFSQLFEKIKLTSSPDAPDQMRRLLRSIRKKAEPEQEEVSVLPNGGAGGSSHSKEVRAGGRAMNQAEYQKLYKEAHSREGIPTDNKAAVDRWNTVEAAILSGQLTIDK